MLRYYGSVFGLLLGLVALGVGHTQLAIVGTGCWTLLTFWLIRERLPAQSLSGPTVRQAVLTSLATPFLSIYWRLYGAFTYRTWYW